MTEHSPRHEPGGLHIERRKLQYGEQIVLPLFRSLPDEKLNADVIAVLEFPPAAQHEGKRVAVVDYGPDYETKLLIPEARGLGRPRERYGLRATNYIPDTHLLAYAPLPTGQEVAIGRDEYATDRTSYMLGLTAQTPGNEAVSRQHLTIGHNNQALVITDISSNGTVVEFLREA